MFRDRYISPSPDRLDANLTIDGLSSYEIDNVQAYILSFFPEYDLSSAQAFMQGFYPPANVTSDHALSPMNLLVNGTMMDYPLGGYQYPQILTASLLDPNYIFIAGDVNCSAHVDAASDYFNSPTFSQTKAASQGFYSSFQSTVFDGVFPDGQVSYDQAYEIFEYLNYGFTHNQTIKQALSTADLGTARSLADQWMYAINGNSSSNSTLNAARTIAGQTMAAQAGQLLLSNVETQGIANKISFLFGSFEPIMAFASLAQLPLANKAFYGIPNVGSSMVFEMYSIGHNSSQGYPDFYSLNVRFLFRNGTDPSSPLTMYPLFGRSDTQGDLSLQDFLTSLEDISTSWPGDWCSTCHSENNSVFCPFYSGYIPPTSINSHQKSSTSIKPAVAGVIGAVVTLGVIGLALAAAVLLGGVRFSRIKTRRRSDLGGFKAGEKLASDPDLPVAKGVAGASVVKNGKDRISSWELAENARAKEANARDTCQPSFEADDLDNHLSKEPTKIEERV